MAKQKPAKQKKNKPNLNRPAPRPVVHLDYLRVYHEVLKHEEILDYELDDIFNATIKVLETNLVDKKLSQQPDGYNIEVLVSLVMEELVDKPKALEEALKDPSLRHIYEDIKGVKVSAETLKFTGRLKVDAAA